ncbi:hypothetical protein Tco_0853122 [Tanacetum coccineum]
MIYEIYKMPLEQFQVNTKFFKHLPDEWSKFVTDVKLVKDLHTTNVDQLLAYLQQHERHANEVRLMHERNSDPLALVASHQLTQPAYQSHLHIDSYGNKYKERRRFAKDHVVCRLLKGRGLNDWLELLGRRVGSNGNLLWEASVLLGRKKGG